MSRCAEFDDDNEHVSSIEAAGNRLVAAIGDAFGRLVTHARDAVSSRRRSRRRSRNGGPPGKGVGGPNDRRKLKSEECNNLFIP